MLELDEFTDRYLGVWNASAAETRRHRVRELYASDAIFAFYRRDPVCGHPAILEQITAVRDLYVPVGHLLRPSHNVIYQHNVVRLNWVMASSSTGEIEAVGQDVLVLDDDGRIKVDYQFLDGFAAPFMWDDGRGDANIRRCVTCY